MMDVVMLPCARPMLAEDPPAKRILLNLENGLCAQRIFETFF